MSISLQNVMVQLGAMSEVMDVLVDEQGLTIGPHGRLDWNGLEVSTEVGPSWCTIRVLTSSAAEALFFVPADPLSARNIRNQVESRAAQAGAHVTPPGTTVPA